MGSVCPPSEVSQKELPEMSVREVEGPPNPETLPAIRDGFRERRIARLGVKCNALMRSGYYGREDVEGIREMARNGICLTQLEWLVMAAEEDAYCVVPAAAREPA